MISTDRHTQRPTRQPQTSVKSENKKKISFDKQKLHIRKKTNKYKDAGERKRKAHKQNQLLTFEYLLSSPSIHKLTTGKRKPNKKLTHSLQTCITDLLFISLQTIIDQTQLGNQKKSFLNYYKLYAINILFFGRLLAFEIFDDQVLNYILIHPIYKVLKLS